MTMLSVSQLTKQYGPGKGIIDFNMTLNSGDSILLLGPNGAGKTTAIRTLLGLTSSQSGSIVFNDSKTEVNPTEFLKSVGAMVGSPVFYDYMTGYENLKLYSAFYDNVTKERIQEVLDIVELTESKDTKVAKYSTGMKQSLDFARAILHQPKILFLDEPFNGMDIEKKAALKDYLQGLQRYSDLAIVISSHMVGDLEKFANRVMIVYEGTTLFDGTMKGILETDESLEEFYLKKIHASKAQKAMGIHASKAQKEVQTQKTDQEKEGAVR